MNEDKFVWIEDYLPVYGHTSISYLKSCPGFYAAKNGDIDSADKVVSICAKKALSAEIKQRFQGAVLLPIITDNKLPQALANTIGMEVNSSTRMYKTVDRKSLSAMERLLHSPEFYGDIKKGETYVLVDDVITQGGTISALRRHVLSQGGIVTAVVTLAFSKDSHGIVPSHQDLSNLMVKFNGRRLCDILRKYRIANEVGELTKSQVRYLLKFNELNKIVSKLESASDALGQKGYKVMER